MFETIKAEDLEAGWKALGGGGVGSAIPMNITQSEAEQVMTVFEDILNTLQ